MMSFKRSRLFCIIFIFSVFFYTRTFTESYPVKNSSASICILAYDTDFKNALTMALVEELNSMEQSVTVDTMKQGKKHRAEDYDVVVLLSGARFGRAMSEACDYIKANNYSANIVYFFTTGASTSPFDKNMDTGKIDAITSASKLKDQDSMEKAKKEILEKIEMLN